MILPGRVASAVFLRGRFAGRNESLSPIRSKQLSGHRGVFSLVEIQVRGGVPAYGSSDASAVSWPRVGDALEIPDRKPGRFLGYLGLDGWA